MNAKKLFNKLSEYAGATFADYSISDDAIFEDIINEHLAETQNEMNTKNKDRGLKKTDTFPILVSDLDKLLDRIAALDTENAALKEQSANPWAHMNPADPGTLPPFGERVLVATWLAREESFVIPGRRVADGIVNIFGDNVAGRIYAWQPWPEPPPFPGTADNQETQPMTSIETTLHDKCEYCHSTTPAVHHYACPNNTDGRWQPVRPGYHGVVGIKRPKWGIFADGR